ncbi:hypothetical protein D3C86_1271120 [compost metagenome]
MLDARPLGPLVDDRHRDAEVASKARHLDVHVARPHQDQAGGRGVDLHEEVDRPAAHHPDPVGVLLGEVVGAHLALAGSDRLGPEALTLALDLAAADGPGESVPFGVDDHLGPDRVGDRAARAHDGHERDRLIALQEGEQLFEGFAAGAQDFAFSCMARQTRSGVAGSCVTWVPMASAIAARIAGGVPISGGSPTPRAP